MNCSGLFFAALVAGLGLAGPSHAQSTVYMPALVEESGPGAVSGTNYRDGLKLAVEEINAKGGILGKKIDMPVFDTQSEAGVSVGLVQKVLDNKPYVVFGPVYSGSVLVDMEITQKAEIPEIVGGEAATHHPEGQPLHLPHLVRPAVQHAENRQLHRRRPQGQDRRARVGEQRFRQARPR